ncbi:MAG: nuclear transport factor 2 family protein [Caulobacterales bacterium]
MTDIEKLLAIEDVKKLKAAYFRCMDTKAWDELAGVFTENATFDVRGALELPKPDDQYEEPIISGRAAIVDYIRTGLSPLISVHYGHMPEIEILSATEATGIWPMVDILVPPAGGPFKVFRGYGHYRETYRKTGGKWCIETLKLRRLFVETE